MVRRKVLNKAILLGACMSLICSRLPAVEPAIEQTVRMSGNIIDVATPAGRLGGCVVDRQGTPQVHVPTKLESISENVVSVYRSDRNGRFSIPGPRGGLYRLTVGGHSSFIRIWSADAAPPRAVDDLCVVVGATVRGQVSQPPGHFDGLLLRTLRNPWVVGGITAAAIAIPLALDDDDAS